MPFAWAAFGSWRGDSRLLARAVRAVEEAVPGRPVTVELRTPEDVERFDSARELVELATPEALTGFEAVVITGAVGEDVEVVLRFQRRQYRRDEWASLEPEILPRAGVGLTVADPDEPTACARRDDILRVLERGISKLRLKRRPSVGTGDRHGARNALLARGEETDVMTNVANIGAVVVMFGLAVAMASLLSGFDRERIFGPPGLGTVVLAGAVSVAVGGWIWVTRRHWPNANPTLRILHPVEVSEVPAYRRFVAVAAALGTASKAITSIAERLAG